MKTQKGFTLVELVVSLLSVIGLILVVVLIRYCKFFTWN